MSGDGPVSSDDGLAEGPVEAYFDAGEGRSVVLFAPARGGRPLADEATQGQGLPVGKATRVLLIDQIEDDVALVRDLLARAEGAAFLVRHTEDPRDGLSALLRGITMWC
jgi:hypothetical protein